ncbi:MAG: sigma-70 family RNA polymerase sigma factor, partial [Opitutaceae bacterium]
MVNDSQLLGRYLAERSEPAFTELVRRHLNLVYFAALRRVGGDRHLADDVTQTVFADLARKAASLANRPALAGWLYTSTRFAAAQAVRSARRRRVHEQEAHTMHALHAAPEPDWNRLRPAIDGAMDELSEPEREAVLLRFFENLPLAEIGARFASSPDAARMRVERALDKLRERLAKRGIVSTSAALAAVFAGQSSVAAPASLVPQIVASAFASSGAAVATSTFVLWKIFAGVAVGGAAIGLFAVATRTESTSRTTAPEIAVAFETTPPLVEMPAFASVPPTEQRATLATPSSPPVTPAAPLPVAPDFATFSARQKIVLKRLWEHERVSPNTKERRWGFRVPADSPGFIDFVAAVAPLRTLGLVGVGQKHGMILLTEKGVEFCRTHAAELDLVTLPPIKM